MAKSQFFRVATEGATTDGRKIDAQWLRDIAETYNRATYGARVNVEHINGVSPDGPFGSYGDVLAVKVEPVQLSVGGKTESRLALYAEIEALDNLVALNQAGQKLYTSIEVNPNFAASGKAYLMGIAVTDNPASLGTEMLTFCAEKGDASPLHARKKAPGNLFTAAEETKILFAGDPGLADAPPAQGSDLLEFLKTWFGFSAKPPVAGETPPAVAAPVAPPAATTPAAPALDPNMAAAFAGLIASRETEQQGVAALTARVTAAEAETAQLRTALENTSPYGFRQRPTSTGSDTAERADC